MIKIDNVSKKFTKLVNRKKKISFYADKNISFEVKGGEIVGILGPNGAGKTTLLRIIAGVMKETAGRVEIDGLTYKKNEIDIKKRIAFLTGNTKLYKDISPYELLVMTGDYYGMNKNTVKDRIKELSDKFDMNDFLHQRIDNLSTGQMQKVAVSRCLIHDPKYYIFDEPTSGLDIISSKTILDIIKEEKKNNKCILYSTHYMEEAENICDRVILINKGEIIESGTPEFIRKKTKTNNLRDAFFVLTEDNNEKY